MTKNLWHNLYLTSSQPSSEQAAALLRDALTAQGYTHYDPFGRAPGKVYDDTVRLFVAPVQRDWVRVLSDRAVPIGMIESVSQAFTVLSLRLTGDDMTAAVYANGQALMDTAAALEPHLRDGKTAADLHSALSKPDVQVIDAKDTKTDLPLDALPDEMQSMAGNVDVGAANRMFENVTGKLFGRTGGDPDAAREVLDSSKRIDWNSPLGWQARALMELLTVPENWREPSFIALRDAYSLHARRQRKPDARLYPGDEAAMRAVPDALDYVPVYAGRNA